MEKIINKVRNQSEEVKRHILHVSVIGCGIVLIMLWIYSLGTNFTDKDTQAKLSQDLKPLSALKANLIGGYNSINQPNPVTDQQTQ